MLFLRWLIGALSAVGLAGFFLILTVGKGLGSASRSGAGSESAWRDLLVLAIPVLLLAMLVSVFTPRSTVFLRILAAGVAAAAVASLAIVRQNPVEGSIYVGFLTLWLIYFALVTWGG